MKYLIFFAKIFLDAYRDTFRVIKHFKMILINGFIIVPKLYYIRLFYSFSLFRNLIKVKLKSNFVFDDYFEDANISSSNLTKTIDEYGHTKTYKLKDELKKEFIKEIFLNKDLEYKKNTFVDKKKIMKYENEDLNLYFDRLKKNNISRLTGFIDLKKENSVRSFLISKPIVSLVQNYLNSEAFSISASFFISTPLEISKKEKYSNAQFYHWDNDFSKFLKLYIYLTDVDDESGPHVFIPRTHKKKSFESSLCRLYDDKLIDELYSNKVKFLGNSGSIFFADGYGLHKGETPRNKPRLVINAHFGRNKIFYSNKDIYYKDNLL